MAHSGHRSSPGTRAEWQPWALDEVQKQIAGLGADPDSVLEHGVKWLPESWRLADLHADSGHIKCAESTSEPSDETGYRIIRRRHVIEAMRESVRCGFVAAMIWGYGTAGYGPWRVARIVTDNCSSCLDDKLDSIATISEGGDALKTWESFTDSHKVQWLGPAFATKFAYFAARARGAPDYPLIADINTSWAVWHLAQIESSAFTALGYASYVELARSVASAPPEKVEYALFEIGKHLRRQSDCRHQSFDICRRK